MQNYAVIGVGTDITKLAGYALSATGRIGPIALEFENLGKGVANPSSPDATPSGGGNTATIGVKQLTSSGYVDLIPAFTLVAGGRVIKTVSVHTAQLGFFGSGNTKLAISIPNNQAASLRGSHIDIQPVSKYGWGVDTGIDPTQQFPTSTQTPTQNL